MNVSERSAGAVVFHRGEHLGFLLLLSTYWGFPKGLIEPGEDETTAALREIREETGLSVALLAGFRTVDEYWYRRGDLRIKKQAIYFVAESLTRDARISHEHDQLAWFDYNSAMAHLDFVNLRETLRKANEFLKGKKD